MAKALKCYQLEIDGEISLKWKDFRVNFTAELNSLLQDESMVDVSLAVGGQIIQAHKLVLSVCSPYFRSLFKLNPCTHPIVFLKDIPIHAVTNLLDLMYKGEVKVKEEDVSSFIDLLASLQMDDYVNELLKTQTKNKRIFHLSESENNTKAVPRGKRKLPKKVTKLRNPKAKKLKIKVEDVDEVVKIEEETITDSDYSDSDYSPLARQHAVDPLARIPENAGNNIKDKTGNLKENTEVHEAQQGKVTNQPSRVWEYYDMVVEGVRCKLCGKKLRGRKATNAKRHLATIHKAEFAESANEIYFRGINYQMLQTKRGRDMLLYHGFLFTQNRMCKDGMRWQCTTLRCRAYCHMSSAGWLTPYSTQHNHEKPPETKIQRIILRMELKARAQSSGATVGEILRHIGPTHEVKMGERATLSRCIQRYRKALFKTSVNAEAEPWPTMTDMDTRDKANAPVWMPPGNPQSSSKHEDENTLVDGIWPNQPQPVQLSEDEKIRQLNNGIDGTKIEAYEL